MLVGGQNSSISVFHLQLAIGDSVGVPIRRHVATTFIEYGYRRVHVEGLISRPLTVVVRLDTGSGTASLGREDSSGQKLCDVSVLLLQVKLLPCHGCNVGGTRGSVGGEDARLVLILSIGTPLVRRAPRKQLFGQRVDQTSMSHATYVGWRHGLVVISAPLPNVWESAF